MKCIRKFLPLFLYFFIHLSMLLSAGIISTNDEGRSHKNFIGRGFSKTVIKERSNKNQPKGETLLMVFVTKDVR